MTRFERDLADPKLQSPRRRGPRRRPPQRRHRDADHLRRRRALRRRLGLLLDAGGAGAAGGRAGAAHRAGVRQPAGLGGHRAAARGRRGAGLRQQPAGAALRAASWTPSSAIGPTGGGVSLSVADWCSEGLLAIFFLIVGLEIRREMTAGSLSDPRAAAAPVLAALGGVLVAGGDLPGAQPGAHRARLVGARRHRHRLHARHPGGVRTRGRRRA